MLPWVGSAKQKPRRRAESLRDAGYMSAEEGRRELAGDGSLAKFKT